MRIASIATMQVIGKWQLPARKTVALRLRVAANCRPQSLPGPRNRQAFWPRQNFLGGVAGAGRGLRPNNRSWCGTVPPVAQRSPKDQGSVPQIVAAIRPNHVTHSQEDANQRRRQLVSRVLKLLLVVFLLAAGIFLATFFRAGPQRNDRLSKGSYGNVELRGSSSSSWRGQCAGIGGGHGHPRRGPVRLDTIRVPTAIGMALDEPRTPPRMAERYPGRINSFAVQRLDGKPQPPAWTPLFGNAATGDLNTEKERRESGARNYRIRDGDTLGMLAKRYLGDENRWPEILEANAKVLTDPEVLPLGAVIRIPATESPGTEDSASQGKKSAGSR